MLRELTVQNLALIEDARVALEPGFCVWSGETGAGKSLLLTALGLVLGEKAASDLVRAGKDEARAAAVFDLDSDALRADVARILGGELDDDHLIVTRRVSTQGRGAAHVNGLPVPIATLRALGARLVGVHGQHETRGLIDPDQQRALLDAHAGHQPLLEAYRAARDHHETLRVRRETLTAARDRRARERELLLFERDELAALQPRAGEYAVLVQDAHRLAHVEELRAATAEGYAALYEADSSVQARLSRVARRLGPLADIAPELAHVATDLERLAEESRECARQLRRFSQTWDDDPERLEAIEDRLAEYRRLATRFHCPPDDLEARQLAITAELDGIHRDETDLSTLDAALAGSWQALGKATRALSAARRKAAAAFARAVETHLADLALDAARLEVHLATTELPADPASPAPPPAGADAVELLFTPNPGEPPRPLRKIASGGELSRVMLAIKSVLAGADDVPTLVFDEIDAGVGGRLGETLGRKLNSLAAHHQVLCVTHLPQLASHAAHQWVIRKQVERGRTHTTITRLDDPERVDELAAMLRGEQAADSTRHEARAMLEQARNGPAPGKLRANRPRKSRKSRK